MNLYQRYPNLPTLTFSLFPPGGTYCKLPRKNGDCWSLLIIIIIAVLLYIIIIMIIFGTKAYILTLYTSDRSMRTRTNVVSLLLLQIFPYFSNICERFKCFSFIQLLGLLLFLLLLFFGFSIDVNSFSTSAGETFLKKRKRDLLFSFFTHIPPLSVSLSELSSKVTGKVKTSQS